MKANGIRLDDEAPEGSQARVDGRMLRAILLQRRAPLGTVHLDELVHWIGASFDFILTRSPELHLPGLSCAVLTPCVSDKQRCRRTRALVLTMRVNADGGISSRQIAGIPVAEKSWPACGDIAVTGSRRLR
jgi:hypothetical protein